MLKILMGPNVKILMGQSLGSWTHGHGPMAWAQGLAHGPGPGPMAAPWKFVPGGLHGPMPMRPGAKALVHEYFNIWAHKYF